MASKLTRRRLLAASLGALQLGLLDRFMGPAPARAAGAGNGPSRLLVLYLPGGVRFYPVFIPVTPEEHVRVIPPPQNILGEPVFCRPDQVVTLGGDAGGYQPLRIASRWNAADPGERSRDHSPIGYSWEHFGLSQNTAVIHGIDQGSFAHGAAYVAAMCGVAGEAYRAPSIASVVANHLHARHADSRPIPCVAINGRGVPSAFDLPSSASPTVVPDANTLAALFSSDPMRHRHWRDAAERTPETFENLHGGSDTVALTNVDRHLLERTRRLHAQANAEGRLQGASHHILEQIHGSYAAVSRTLAADVVAAVEAVTPSTIERPEHLRGFGMYNFTFGPANGRIEMVNSCEWILRLLKSNVTSTVFANLPERYYDYHNGATVPEATAATAAQLDILARMMGEMKATPSPDRPDRSLYDDTLIVIQSEFNRTWPRGIDQDTPDSWTYGDDHHASTSVVLSGGGIQGGRQIGGFDVETTTGIPVAIREETGEASTRVPQAADLAATIYDAFGMEAGADYFIPGGYGVIQGICP